MSVDLHGIYSVLTSKGWQRGSDSFSAGPNFDRGSTNYGGPRDFLSDDNTRKNVTNARATRQFVAIHQEIDGEKFWREHHNQPIFRILDPHDHDHENFLRERERIIEKYTIPPLITNENAKFLYGEDRLTNADLRTGSYPYGRYQTLPQLNYTSALAQLQGSSVFTYTEMWSRVRPTGICITSDASRENHDGVIGDIRVCNVTGPEKVHNVFGRCERGWQVGVIIYPVEVKAGEKFFYRVSADGSEKIVEAHEKSRCVIDKGYFWQFKFYACETFPDLDEYSARFEKSGLVTGGFIRLGRFHYDFVETRPNLDFFQKGSLATSLKCDTDMLHCVRAPLCSIFWDPSTQKCY